MAIGMSSMIREYLELTQKMQCHIMLIYYSIREIIINLFLKSISKLFFENDHKKNLFFILQIFIATFCIFLSQKNLQINYYLL